MDTLVSVNELIDSLDNTDWCIADCRFSLSDAQAGQCAYDESHIRGAFYVNLDTQMSIAHRPGETGRHPLPDKADWIQTVQRLGITPQTQVVVYDDAGGAIAARMWWMLRWIGHDKVALLNGGWQHWQKAAGATSNSVPATPKLSETDYAALPSLVKVQQAQDLENFNDQQQLLLDAREGPRFRGEVEPLDPVAGHIPGAVCSPFSGNLDADGCFLKPAQLQDKFSSAFESGKDVICYCGSGVTAAHNILALKIAGLNEAALYPGSWSEWITDSSRPIATGD